MGRVFLIYLEGNLYSCKHCQAHLGLAKDIISKVYLFHSLMVFLSGNVGGFMIMFADLFSINGCLKLGLVVYMVMRFNIQMLSLRDLDLPVICGMILVELYNYEMKYCLQGKKSFQASTHSANLHQLAEKRIQSNSLLVYIY